MTSPRDHKDLDLLLVDAQLHCAHEDQLCLGAQGPYVAAGYHDDDYHYTLPCVGGPTDRQAAAQPRLRLTAAAGRAATLQNLQRIRGCTHVLLSENSGVVQRRLKQQLRDG